MLKMRKQNSLCRKCNHGFSSHCMYVRVEHGCMSQDIIQPLEMVPCNGNPSYDPVMLQATMSNCGCISWEPLDNLEYLEFKATQNDTK
jgi:hypothetical protein